MTAVAMKTTADVRAWILAEWDLTEDDLGDAVLTVTPVKGPTPLSDYWEWDYQDSLTHDFGIAYEIYGGGLNAQMNDASTSADSGGWEY